MTRLRALVVERAGPLTTVQDLGRPGLAHLGVTRGGAADRSSLRLANRLVANREGAAALEVTLGGLVLTSLVPVTIAVTGAGCPIVVAGRRVAAAAPVAVAAGAELALGPATTGLRAYLAVRGGIAVAPVLGSRSWDGLAGLGPRPLADGDLVPLGDVPGAEVEGRPAVDHAAVPGLPGGGEPVRLRAVPGPDAGRLPPAELDRLWTQLWQVAVHSDRVAVRLAAAAGLRREPGEVAPTGLVRGAVQLPPSGLPLIFLADHPVTGGYPVVAVLRDAEVDRAAQLRPGQPVQLVRY